CRRSCRRWSHRPCPARTSCGAKRHRGRRSWLGLLCRWKVVRIDNPFAASEKAEKLMAQATAAECEGDEGDSPPERPPASAVARTGSRLLRGTRSATRSKASSSTKFTNEPSVLTKFSREEA